MSAQMRHQGPWPVLLGDRPPLLVALPYRRPRENQRTPLVRMAYVMGRTKSHLLGLDGETDDHATVGLSVISSALARLLLRWNRDLSHGGG